jgi:hypothetical protein
MCGGDRPRLLQNSKFCRLKVLFRPDGPAGEIAPAVRPGSGRNER